jgi:hypothetical protein
MECGLIYVPLERLDGRAMCLGCCFRGFGDCAVRPSDNVFEGQERILFISHI